MIIVIVFRQNAIYTENLNNLGVTFPCFPVSVIGVSLGLSHSPNAASSLYPNFTQIGKQKRAWSMADGYSSSG